MTQSVATKHSYPKSSPHKTQLAYLAKSKPNRPNRPLLPPYSSTISSPYRITKPFPSSTSPYPKYTSISSSIYIPHNPLPISLSNSHTHTLPPLSPSSKSTLFPSHQTNPPPLQENSLPSKHPQIQQSAYPQAPPHPLSPKKENKRSRFAKTKKKKGVENELRWGMRCATSPPIPL